MKLKEEAEGVSYEIIVQHDAEDIVHPKAFKLINGLLGRYDMVQIPVLPLVMPPGRLTHGTYCDEFAEYQMKDAYTRHAMGGFVPSAGVGTAFSREALEEMARNSANQIYNVSTLTEDYDIGWRFYLQGKRQCFVRHSVPGAGRNGAANGRPNGKRETIATREYFPHTFRGAVTQKSRWVMGVALQAWEQRGWQGGLRQKYWLWRDRKALAGNLVTMAGNLLALYCLLMWAGARWLDSGWGLANVIPAASVLWWLLPVNMFFLSERLFCRFFFVHRVYGLRQAAWSLLRIPWANFINCASTVWAWRTYLRAKLLRQDLKWAKTAHAFPTREQLMAYKRRLGELLLEGRLVTAAVLEQALEEQLHSQERLGEILVRQGVLTEWEVLRALGRQQNIEVREVDPYEIDLQVLRQLPQAVATAHQVIPLGAVNGDTLVVASHDLIREERLLALEAATGLRIHPVLTTPADLAFAQERAYGRLRFDPRGRMRLGQALLQAGLLSPEQLEGALREQKRMRHTLAEVLLEKGWVDEEGLRLGFLQAAGRDFRRIGAGEADPVAAALIPHALQLALRALPFECRDGWVRVAVGWPLAEADHAALERASGRRVELVYALPRDVAAILGATPPTSAAASAA
jgi:adsorption protein B